MDYDDRKKDLRDFYTMKRTFDRLAQDVAAVAKDGVMRGDPSALGYKVRPKLPELEGMRDYLWNHPAAAAADGKTAAFSSSHGGDAGLLAFFEAKRLVDEATGEHDPSAPGSTQYRNFENTSVAGDEVKAKMGAMAPRVQSSLESDATSSADEQAFRWQNESTRYRSETGKD